MRACQTEILPGPGKILCWGVPDGRRDEMGKPIHDDLLVSAMLCTRLEAQSWARGESQVIEAEDPLEGMRSVY